jgi:ABC-type transporter Mla maintaining outer membrane lipid asymmetry ATPase subunit MlaF
MNGAVLELKDVVKAYGDRRVLDGVSFRVRKAKRRSSSAQAVQESQPYSNW